MLTPLENVKAPAPLEEVKVLVPLMECQGAGAAGVGQRDGAVGAVWRRHTGVEVVAPVLLKDTKAPAPPEERYWIHCPCQRRWCARRIIE